MEVVCKGRVRFDIERGRIRVDPEGDGIEELEPGMRVWIVIGDPNADKPNPYRITPEGWQMVLAA